MAGISRIEAPPTAGRLNAAVAANGIYFVIWLWEALRPGAPTAQLRFDLVRVLAQTAHAELAAADTAGDRLLRVAQGDLLEGEDPFLMPAQKSSGGLSATAQPAKDEKLYDL